MAPGGVVAADRYTRVAVWLHWIIAALVLFNLFSGILGPGFGFHKASGITVLFLSVVRLAWRLAHRPPPLPAMPRWQAVSGKALHWLFYVLIILMPLSGWVFSSTASQRRPLNWFGLFDIPYLPLPQTKEGGDPAYAFHTYAGWLMVALVALHVAAALKHHFVDRDRTLVRIAPALKQR